MVESSRIYFLNKPRLILDKKFPFARELETGTRGQIQATLEVIGLDMNMVNSNETQVTSFRVIKAEPIKLKGKRVDE